MEVGTSPGTAHSPSGFFPASLSSFSCTGDARVFKGVLDFVEKDSAMQEVPACISEDAAPARAVKKKKKKKKKRKKSVFQISASSLLDESSLDGSHLIVKCTLSNGNENPSIDTPALTDCGASGYAFVDE